MTDTPHKAEHAAFARPQRWSFAPSTVVLMLGVALVIGYAGGTRHEEIMATVEPMFGKTSDVSRTLDLSSVQETYRLLRESYDGDIDQAALIAGASRGLTAGLGDPHTVYFDAQEATEFNDSLQGNIGGGIGAELGLRDDHVTVLRPLANTPAQRAGLMKGDIIMFVNDEDANGWDVSQTAQKIRGEIGTTVKLVVLRDGAEQEFSITREAINQPGVEYAVDGSIGTLTITRFDDTTVHEAQEAAKKLMAANVKSVVLDLRDNGGGKLGATTGVAGLWLDNKVVVTERTGDKVVGELRSDGEQILAGVPTVVLVNGGSASAAEIVAAALQDHKAAVLVGEKTYGKGTVQKTIDTRNGGMLKVTIQRWFTPNGKNLDGNGIEPNKKVVLSREDVNADRDPQFDAAKAELNK